MQFLLPAHGRVDMRYQSSTLILAACVLSIATCIDARGDERAAQVLPEPSPGTINLHLKGALQVLTIQLAGADRNSQLAGAALAHAATGELANEAQLGGAKMHAEVSLNTQSGKGCLGNVAISDLPATSPVVHQL